MRDQGISSIARKLLTVTLPVTLATLILTAAAIEIYARATWDPRRGTPGFYVADPVLSERLGRNYSGWFAGVPVQTNNLGFRDERDYSLQKGPRTFRILVLGDSVTFGHGSMSDRTYPYLLEQNLKRWRPDVDWQVWNAGVPGYTTSHELAYLLEVGPRFEPDLVVLGFYWNDWQGNFKLFRPGPRERLVSAIKAALKQRSYSHELYKKAYYALASRILESPWHGAMLVALEDEVLLMAPDDLTQLEEQQITYPAELDVGQPTACDGGELDPATSAQQARTSEAWLEAVRGFQDQSGAWLEAVRGFQALNRSDSYRLFAFLNIAPDVCNSDDRFFDGAMQPIHDYYADLFSRGGLQVVSPFEEFKRYRPSQMPLANGHSLGNSNWVKARVLFEFLQARLVAELQARVPTGR